MAEARTARLVDARELGPETRLMSFALPEGQRLGFAGGQYVIVNTGVPLPGGKVAKRAYSILSGDSQQDRFEVAVRRVGDGPGSNFMHGLAVGAEVPFSGPWGKYLVDPTAEPDRVLVFATDTGVTAALGLIRGEGFRRLLPRARVVWMVESRESFLPESWLGAVIPSECASFATRPGPPVHHPERVAFARDLLREAVGGGDGPPSLVYLSGDGAVLYPLAVDMAESGLAEGQVRLECFFNNPQRRAP